MFKLVYTSPVLSPFSIFIEKGGPENIYQSGPYASERAARRHMKSELVNYLDSLVAAGGETPWWHYPPSGGESPAPAWWGEYGFAPVDNGGDYWNIKRA